MMCEARFNGMGSDQLMICVHLMGEKVVYGDYRDPVWVCEIEEKDLRALEELIGCKADSIDIDPIQHS